MLFDLTTRKAPAPMTSSPASRRAVTVPLRTRNRMRARSAPRVRMAVDSAQASVGASQWLLGRSRAVPAELTADLQIEAREP